MDKAISLSSLAPHVGDNDLGILQVPAELKSSYTTVYFLWLEQFIEYQAKHAMQPILDTLKQDLDPLSYIYIYIYRERERHERLLELCKSNQHCLVKLDYVWTEEDRKLYDRYQKQKEAGTPSFLNNVDFGWGTAYINQYGLYDLPEQVIANINGKAIIDAGAYNGDTLMLFRSKFKDSTCYCFEPDSKNYDYLSKMFRRDIKQGKVHAYHQALGQKADKLVLNKAQSNFALNESSTFAYDYHNKHEEELVDVITLDSFIERQNRENNQLQEIGLIKMDVEGFEKEVILGALETIKKHKPVLVIAFYHFPEEFYELKPYLESLNLGYKFQVRRSNFVQNIYEPPAVPLYDLVLIAYPS